MWLLQSEDITPINRFSCRPAQAILFNKTQDRSLNLGYKLLWTLKGLPVKTPPQILDQTDRFEPYLRSSCNQLTKSSILFSSAIALATVCFRQRPCLLTVLGLYCLYIFTLPSNHTHFSPHFLLLWQYTHDIKLPSQPFQVYNSGYEVHSYFCATIHLQNSFHLAKFKLICPFISNSLLPFTPFISYKWFPLALSLQLHCKPLVRSSRVLLM